MADSLHKLLQGTTLQQEDMPPHTADTTGSGNTDTVHEANLLKAYRKLKMRSHTKGDTVIYDTHPAPLKLQDALHGVTLPTGLRDKLASVARGDKVVQPALPSVIESQNMRVAGYKQVVKDLDKWDPVINAFNAQKHISFVNKTQTTYYTGDTFEPTNKFERKLFSLIKDDDDDDDVTPPFKNRAKLNADEKRKFRKMTLDEAKQGRQDMKKFRILLSKQESKYRREKRVKSKNFRKMKRIENFKKSPKNSNIYVSEEMRAKERLTLKHSKGSKWINRMNKLNFRDNNMKQTVNLQYQIGKQLKKHPPVTQHSVSDDDDTNEQANETNTTTRSTNNSSNPWLNTSINTPPLLLTNDTTTSKDVNTATSNRGLSLSSDVMFNKQDIDEAFAFDDVTEEFLQEQLETEETAIDNNEEMPGWGSWAEGAVLEKAKNKKIKQTSRLMKEKLSDLKKNPKYVIMNPENRDKLLKHQVRKVPFPYKSKAQFEHMFRRPVGRQWNTELNRASVIKPRIEVRAGQIIPPKKYVEETNTNASYKIIKSKNRKVKLKAK